MRIKLALYFLACIQLSLGLPLLTTYTIEAKIKESITFSSPGYEDGLYPDNIEQYWELSTTHGKVIKIVFDDFDVEYHQKCIWDHVTIVRSRCKTFMARGQGEVVLCGALRDYEFDSDKSPVCIMFSSDKLVSKRGFKAHAFAMPEDKDKSTDISSSTSRPTTEISTESSLSQRTTFPSIEKSPTTKQSSSKSSTTETQTLQSSPTRQSTRQSSSKSSTTETQTLPTSPTRQSTRQSLSKSSTTETQTLPTSPTPNWRSELSTLKASSPNTLPFFSTTSKHKTVQSSSSKSLKGSSTAGSSVSLPSLSKTKAPFQSTTKSKSSSTSTVSNKVTDNQFQETAVTTTTSSSLKEFLTSSSSDISTLLSSPALSSLSVFPSTTSKPLSSLTHASDKTASLPFSSTITETKSAITTVSAVTESPQPRASIKTAALTSTLTPLTSLASTLLSSTSFESSGKKSSPSPSQSGAEVTATTSLSTTGASVLDVIFGEFTESTIDIGQFYEIHIRSPTDGTGSYPLNKHFTITVFNNGHMDVRIEFNLFDIEYHPQCGWDYVQLTIGNEPLHRLCGKTLPEAFSTDADTIEIVFHSDHIVSTRGFEMKITKLASTDVSTKVAGLLNSSTIPSRTRTNQLLSSTSSVSAKESHSTSFSSKLSSLFSTSSSLSSSPISSKPAALKPSPSSIGTTTTSSSSKTTNPSTTSTKTTKIPSSSATPNTLAASIESSTKSTTPSSPKPTKRSITTPPPVLDVVICETAEKDIDLSDLLGVVVRSPKDDTGRYPLNTNGILTINNQLEQDVDIEFPHFDIEYHPDCKWDYLMLKLGDQPSYRLCGHLLPNPRSTKANRIELEFHSDHIASLSGFEMKLMKHSKSATEKTQSTTHFTNPTNFTTNPEGVTTITINSTTSDILEGKTTSVGTTVTTPTNVSSLANSPYKTSAITVFPTYNASRSNSFETTLTGQVLVTSEKQRTTNVHHQLTSEYASKITTQMLSSGTSAGNINTASKSTTLSNAADKTKTLTTFTPSLTETTRKSTTGFLSSVSQDGQVPVTLGNQGKLEATTPEHNTIIPSSTSASQKQMSTTDSLGTTASKVPSSKTARKSTISDTVQATISQQFPHSEEHILSTISKSSSTSLTTEPTKAITSIPTATVPKEPAACSENSMPEVLDSEYGYITSPGFGTTEYPPNSNCQWKITAMETKVILIIFQSFDVENSPGCRWDNLIIYETSNDEQTRSKLVTLCGSNIPLTLSSNNSLIVEFKSDSAQQRAGFRFQYIKIDSESGETYTCPPGKITCTSNGVCIPAEWWCDGSEDCDDKSDELYCHKCPDGEVECGVGVCLDRSYRCDGISQCPYATDERECVSILNGSALEQPVQVNVQGSWLPLCYNDVTASRSDDVCKMANYRSTELLTKGNTDNRQMFSVATPESGRLNFTTSSTCTTNTVLQLQCTYSDCGKKEEHVRKKRIIGGAVSQKGEWPWSVALRSGNSVICGGSIIDSLWLVTAGHCVKDLVENPQITSVVAGVNDINDAERQIRYVSEVVVHPEYHFIFNADIALLRLQRPLHFDNNTKPICLPWDMRQFSPWDLCYVTGFGVSDMKDYYTTVTPKFLRHVKTKIFDLQKCKDIYSTRFSSDNRIRDNMLCAGYTSSGMDACKGDSGGGLMCRGSDDRWLLAGVVSWGDMCGMSNRPGVYTNILSFMDWIAETTNPNGAKNVTCDFEWNGWCGYTDISDGNYVWTRKPGDKYVKGTILYATRTSALNSNGPSNASLLTPTFSTTSLQNCLMFSFMFSGNSNITFSVFGIDELDDGRPMTDLLWRVTSHYPAKDTWMSTEVTVSETYMRLKFVSLNEHGGIPGLGLDNVTLVKGTCDGSEFTSCTFDEGDTCRFSQSSGHNTKNWTIVQENADVLTYNQQDHCIKAGGNFSTFGYQAFAQFISPELNNQFTSLPHCVTFSFNKKTPTNNDLELSTYVHFGSQLTNQKVFWTSDAAEIGIWTEASVTLPHDAYDHIVFELRRKEYTYEIIEVLLDDIQVKDGVCV